MVTLTYKDLDAIVRGLVLALDEADEYQMETEPYERVWRKLYAALEEIKGIEPKPQFMLTREGE